MIKIRYKMRQSSSVITAKSSGQEAADNLINIVMKLSLPEVDMD